MASFPPDNILGTAEAISIRFTFFRAHTMRRRSWCGEPTPEREEIPLGSLRKALCASGLEKPLASRVQSFQNDIVTPFATDSSSPLIVLCEPFKDGVTVKGESCAPHEVEIVFPAVFKMLWEGDLIELPMSSNGSSNPIRAKLVDNVTFFESGYLAYSISLIFEPDSDSVHLSAPGLLMLGATAKPATPIKGDRVRFSMHGGKSNLLPEFLHERLKALDELTVECRTIFSFLKSKCEPDFAGPIRSRLRDSLLNIDFSQPESRDSALLPGCQQHKPADARSMVSIGIEIIGASKHKKVLKYAKAAHARTAELDPFSKCLAGLVQNVQDFKRQDKEEICDSLASYDLIGDEITFCHKAVAVRFSTHSRAYEKMVEVVGGEPYWFLVQLILGHNEMLLHDLKNDLEHSHGLGGMTGMMDHLLRMGPRTYSFDETKKRVKQTQQRRIRLAHYIPNLFRYPTEQALYRLFSDARGLGTQFGYFQKLEDTLETMTREISILNKERADRHITGVLVALGVIQIAAVVIGFATLGREDFWFFLTHLFPRHWHLFVKGLSMGISPNDASEEMFRLDWALIPALVIMVGGILVIVAVGAYSLVGWIRSILRRLRCQ